jgi:hypothetical protein
VPQHQPLDARRIAARRRLAEAEARAGVVERPAGRRQLEGCPLSGVGVGDLEAGACDGRVVGQARSRRRDAVAGEEHQPRAQAVAHAALLPGERHVERARVDRGGDEDHERGGDRCPGRGHAEKRAYAWPTMLQVTFS